MRESLPVRRSRLVLVCLVLIVWTLVTVAGAQSLSGLPHQIGQSNGCGCGGPSDTVPIASGLLAPFLPKIPNLELGFLYSFGKNVRTGRFTADYVIPFRLSADSVLFGEAHAEGWDFWKRPHLSTIYSTGGVTTTSTARGRVDLSFGGGYRRMVGDSTLVGVNGFYDSSYVYTDLYSQWYSSGGIGLEMAATVADDDAVDLNFNWYGNPFNRDMIADAFKNKGNSFDVEAGYSRALFDHTLDLRLKLVGYQFDTWTTVRGWRGGADLTTQNGMFTLRYEHGQDNLYGDYNTVGGFVTVGCQLENLLSGESPFTLPEPVFKSPRNLRRLLGLKVKRDWNRPGQSTCNLEGYAVIASAIPLGTYVPTTPAIPDPPTSTATLCWCRLLTDTTAILVMNTHANPYSSPTITMTRGSGCITVPIAFNGHYGYSDGPSIAFDVPAPGGFMAFGPGGGVSVHFP